MLVFVKAKAFEQSLLDLAMTTRVPLTRANIAFYTGASTKEADRFLDELVRDGIVEFDSDDNGEITYTVCGAKRPSSGADQLTRCSACQRATVVGTRCARCGRYLDAQLRGLSAELKGAGTALDLVRRGPRFKDLMKAQRPEDEKNLLVAGALGFLGGPLGWFYAAPLKEAGLATVVFLAALKILPMFLWYMLGPVVFLASGAAGVLYAWRYNATSRRTSLLLGDDE